MSTTDQAPAVVGRPTYDCRKTFAEELIRLAENDPRIVAVCNDSVGSSNLVEFRERFPDRLINVGIAEQDLVGVGAGLANGGLIPFVSAAGPFLTGRALEQIKTDVAYSGHRVILCGQSPGFAYGELGPTHHSVEDLSWLRAVADLPVIVPTDRGQTRAAVRWAAAQQSGCYLRVPRIKVPDIVPADAPFGPGQAVTLRQGTGATIIAVGTPVVQAMLAADRLAADGLSIRVLNVPFVVPIDEAAVVRAARETGAVVTVEEATVSGGLGAAVAALVSHHHPVPVRILGVRGFAPTGSAQFLTEYFGLTSDGIVAAVREAIAHGRG